jgi:osmotically-inducible protein OsmY
MRNRTFIATISCVLVGLGSATVASAAVSGQTAGESQEADIGPILRQGQGVDEQTVRDMRAQGEIYNALLQQTDIDPDRLSIQVSDGHVRLTGDVTSDQDRNTVVRLAENTDNVTSVEDDIKITSAKS